jgi:hypothetical protein
MEPSILRDTRTKKKTPCSRSLLEKLLVAQLVKKFSSFYETRGLIAVFTRTRNWILLWASLTQSTSSHPIPLSSTLILSSHRGPGLVSGSSFQVSDQNVQISYFSAFYMSCPFHSPWSYKLWSSSICNFLHHPVATSLSGPNILLSTTNYS